MPDQPQDLADVATSKSVYVGIAESDEMPYTSPLRRAPPFVVVTTHFVDYCWRLSELYSAFAAVVPNHSNVEVGDTARRLLFDHLGLKLGSPSAEHSAEVVEHSRDRIFSERSTAAAIRWAIAHEMGHAVATKAQRTDAYERVESLMPNIMELQWEPQRKQGMLPDFEVSVARFKDEIACDLLANRYVLESPFSADDIVTQISGSLLALEALVWDGWRQDGSAVSQTHPSPTLRFQIALLDWMDVLSDPATWVNRERPTFYGIKDIAYWVVFERWAAGEYGPHRSGARWQKDIDVLLQGPLARIPLAGTEQIYMRDENGIRRVSWP